MGENVKVSGRVVYGKERFYPENEKAKLFAELMKVKSFWRADLKLMQRLGHRVEIVTVLLPDNPEETKDETAEQGGQPTEPGTEG
jgi:hypothetical protein